MSQTLMLQMKLSNYSSKGLLRLAVDKLARGILEQLQDDSLAHAGAMVHANHGPKLDRLKFDRAARELTQLVEAAYNLGREHERILSMPADQLGGSETEKASD